jgi:hypothetical protein
MYRDQCSASLLIYLFTINALFGVFDRATYRWEQFVDALESFSDILPARAKFSGSSEHLLAKLDQCDDACDSGYHLQP